MEELENGEKQCLPDDCTHKQPQVSCTGPCQRWMDAGGAHELLPKTMDGGESYELLSKMDGWGGAHELPLLAEKWLTVDGC